MEDISGQRFGRLVAARPAGRTARDGSPFWVCYCDCGACTAASQGALDRGETTDCGCGSKIGSRFGWLTVTDLRRGLAVCRCDCGTELSLPLRELGSRVSCGCDAGSRAWIPDQVSLFPAENALAWAP